MKQKSENISILAGFLKDNPYDIFSKFALALELLKINEVSKAQILFESVLKQDRDYLGVYYHLGKLYQQTRRFDDARKTFEDGIKVAHTQKNEKTRMELAEALEILNIETENGS
jgi:uncharacterized protein HemY